MHDEAEGRIYVLVDCSADDVSSRSVAQHICLTVLLQAKVLMSHIWFATLNEAGPVDCAVGTQVATTLKLHHQMYLDSSNVASIL